MTEDQEKFALHLINNPPPGSELAKAKEYGVDLTLFISTLRRSPTERARSLYDAGVEFVVIGGAAMGLQGSAHLTKDIDFCYARTSKNMERLAKALEPFHPILRGAPPGLPFRFDSKTIANGLNFTLTTDLGDLDFLGEVSGLGFFQDVLGASDMK